MSGLRTSLALALLLLSAFGASAQAVTASRVSASADWAAGRLWMDFAVPVQGEPDPRSRFRAERRIDALVPEAFMRAVQDVTVDSWSTVRDLLSSDPAMLETIRRLSLQGEQDTAYLSPDLRTVHVRYTFPLIGPGSLESALVTHRRAFPLRPILGTVPAGRFTGLVIYAAEPVPAYGRDEDRLPRPALFPRIYDQDMKLLLEREMCDPDTLREWGMLGYSDSTDLRAHTPRVGPAPLAVMARGVFGRNDTDLLIPHDAARRLLSSEHNRSLLREGRIVVIYASSVSALEWPVPDPAEDAP